MVNLRIDICPNQSVVVRPSGRLDAVSSGFVKRQIVVLTRSGFFRRLILDLAQVPWIDQAGLRVLCEGAQAVRGMGGELHLAGAGEQMQAVLIPVTEHVRCFDTVEAAIAGEQPSLAAAMCSTGATDDLA